MTKPSESNGLIEEAKKAVEEGRPDDVHSYYKMVKQKIESRMKALKNRVYLPVLGELGILKQFSGYLNENLTHLVTKKFWNLAKEVLNNKYKKKSMEAFNK